ncbi:hypothetical protein HanIR_Chr11g0553491 [Helianthus annuus]|nr:hypothetical protein HanIR_Chr11g0553491 [Helianthus annuus]
MNREHFVEYYPTFEHRVGHLKILKVLQRAKAQVRRIQPRLQERKYTGPTLSTSDYLPNHCFQTPSQP